MSARLLRKVLEEKEQQRQQQQISSEPEDGADDDMEFPVFTGPSRNPFDLLDDQEGEDEVDGVEEEVGEQEVTVEKSCDAVLTLDHKSKKKNKKKKKKNNKESATSKKKPEKSFDSILEDLSITPLVSDNQSGYDDSKTISTKTPLNATDNNTSFVLTVDPKYLKAENELRKIFGSKVVNSFENKQGGSSSRQIGGRRASYNPRKTILISPSSHWQRWDGSLSMELLETKNGVHYFKYVHSQSYSYVQEAFEAAKATHDLNAVSGILAHQPYHIEALLTFAEVFKFSGEHESSSDAIGKCLFALECAWHPLFSPMQGNCRLKYSHDKNKPFFIALFNHMKNMDRRGCHRSALEVCKLLLSLDSDDPMGALFCIDYFSLRAHEFAWLEQFSEEYRIDNSMWVFPNFSYSLAICRFYLERDTSSKEFVLHNDKAMSSDLMKQALMLHPLVLKKLVDKAPLKDPAWTQILKNSFFGSAQAGSPSLDHLIGIYVERNYLLWRFPELQNLLKEAALAVIESLKNNNAEAKDWACIRKEAFSSEKNEYSHLLVSDFSNSVPSLPPEELQQFMGGPHLAHALPDGTRDANPERPRALREVAGRNPAIVFLESLLPWMDYGANGNGQQHGDNQ